MCRQGRCACGAAVAGAGVCATWLQQQQLPSGAFRPAKSHVCRCTEKIVGACRGQGEGWLRHERFFVRGQAARVAQIEGENVHLAGSIARHVLEGPLPTDVMHNATHTAHTGHCTLQIRVPESARFTLVYMCARDACPGTPDNLIAIARATRESRDGTSRSASRSRRTGRRSSPSRRAARAPR